MGGSVVGMMLREWPDRLGDSQRNPIIRSDIPVAEKAEAL
jgi:hypothetical protein